MHPIEHLRFVARGGSGHPAAVAREAARALRGSSGHPAELVVACRRLLDRQPGAGPLWWVCSVALTSPEPARALAEVIERLDDDPTIELAVEHFETSPHGVLVEAAAVGPEAVLVARHDRSVDVRSGPPIWVVATEGSVVPPPVWDAALARIEASGATPHCLPHEHVDLVFGPSGPQAPEQVRPTEPFPIAPEILKPGP